MDRAAFPSGHKTPIRSRIPLANMVINPLFQDGVSILGGAIGAMRIPEKWFPGVVDFYLNSHNIMHVLVVVAVYSMHKVGYILQG